MNLLAMAHYAAFIIYVYLIIFVVAKNPKAALNRVCALLIGAFAIWSLGTSFFYAAVSVSNAWLWFNISAFGGCSFASFSLWFSLMLTYHEGLMRKWYFYALLFLLPSFFIYLHWTGRVAYIIQQSSYRTIVWPISPWALPFYVYYLSFMLIAIGLIYKHSRGARYEYERKQARLIIITGGISLILASVNVVILPNINYYILPSMGSIFPLIWTAGMVYAITKYKLMVLTPAYAAADILATMNDSLILIDGEGRLIEVNNATLSLLGYSRAELIGQPAEVLFSAETPFGDRADLAELLKEDSFQEDIVSYRTKNGAIIPVHFSGSIMTDPNHQEIGIVGVARDMREILRLQESERELSVEKARAEALQERAQELQTAYDQLKTIQAQLIQSEKMAAVGQLAGGVAHEINNPIGVILGFAQSINQRINKDHPLHLPIKSIEREAVRCKKMVGDLLTFSRSGKSHAEIIDINQTIDETLSLIEFQAKVKDITIIKKYDPELPRIMANKNQLQQVIMNLCNNAIDAIEAHSEINAGAKGYALNPIPDGDKITITTRRSEKFIDIEVSDTGVGMSQEVKQHIFEPFFTTKEVGKGTGLGLSLCYEILAKHHGGIEVASEPGKGTTFRIKLLVDSGWNSDGEGRR